MPDSILDQNLEQLLRRCHRPVSAEHVDRSLARFERRLVERPRHAGILAIAAAILFAGLATWIAMQGKTPASPSNSSAARPSEGATQDATPAPVPQKDSLARARDLFLDGKFEQVIVETTRILEVDPTRGAALALRARARLRLENADPRTAEEEAAEALRMAPKTSEPLLARGEARLLRDDRDGAQRDATDVLKLDSKNVDAFLLRARAKVRLKDHLGARADLKRAVELEAECGEAYLVLAVLQVDSGRDPGLEYAMALKAGAWTDDSLKALGDQVVTLLKDGLAAAKSDFTARRIVSLLKTYKEGAEAVRAYDEKVAGRRKEMADVDRLIADLASDSAPARKNAEERLIAMGEKVLEALGKARYHEIPEVRVLVLDLIRTISENRATDRALAEIRDRIKIVRARWTARDFTEIDEVLTPAFNGIGTCTFVPVKRIGAQFAAGAEAQITSSIAEALDKNDTIFISSAKGGAPEIVRMGGVALFTLPDKKGWSAYVVVELKK